MMLVPFCPSCKSQSGVEGVKLQAVTVQTQDDAKHFSEVWDCAYLYSEILSLHG